MRIDTVELDGFRNYSFSIAEFSPDVNVICGPNAQGKTNLLEAIYLLCTGKSFRARSDSELISFGADAASVRAKGFSDGRERDMELILRRAGRRTMTVNSVKKRTNADFSESFSAVLFCPEDLGIIRDGAAARRKLMDMCISQLRPRYAAALNAYNRAFEQKTRILKDAEEMPSLLEMLDEYDLHMAKLSAELIHYRAHFIKRMAPAAAAIHAEFSGGEELSIEYKTVSTVLDPLGTVQSILDAVLEHQASHREAERRSGMCLTGIHKDDLEISINGSPARSFASQGQTRTAALSIKLAERQMHYELMGEYPILLLDDVLSELDSGRQNFVLNRIGGGQVFITCCEDDGIAQRTGGKVINIAGGEVCS